MTSGTVIEVFGTKWGHGIKVRDSDGNERRMFGKDQAPNLSPGTPITFKVTRKGQNYHYDNLQAVGQPAAGAWPQQAPQNPYPERPHGGPQTPAPTRPEASNKDTRMMFITRIVGDAMSSGQFGMVDIVMLTLTAADAFDELQKPRKAQRTEEPPPPSEADYGGDAPPEW
jgi:hypothetical protein